MYNPLLLSAKGSTKRRVRIKLDVTPHGASWLILKHNIKNQNVKKNTMENLIRKIPVKFKSLGIKALPPIIIRVDHTPKFNKSL